MADQNTRWENDKEWAGWTIRDEIYGFIRRHLGQTIVTSIIFLGGAIWAFVKEHPLVWEPVGAAVLTVGAITGLALYDGRKRKRATSQHGNALPDTLSISDSSIEAIMMPGPGNTKAVPFVQFETRGQAARELNIGGKPEKLRFVVPTEQIVSERDLPAEILIGKGKLIIKRFTENGLSFEERKTNGDTVKAEIYYAREQAPLTPIRAATPAVAIHAAETNVAVGPSNQLSTQSPKINPSKAVDRILAGASVDSVLQQPEEYWQHLEKIYDFDERRNLLTLKVSLPDDGAREAKALLLLVYGYRVLKGVNDVLIERLCTGLRASGYERSIPIWQVMTGQTIDLNIDGLASEYVRVGALQLHGLRRGRVYSITEDGMERARDILKAIIPILD